MKRTSLTMAGAIIALAMVFTCSSCTKKEEASKGMTQKEELKLTPEQAKQMEAIKKGTEESQKIIVAKVNGADITMYALVKEMNAIVPKFTPHGQPVTPDITAKVKKKALNDLIFKELAIQEAVKEGFTVKPETIDDVILKVKTQSGSTEAYKKYLADRNMNEEGLRKTIERSHLYEGITARKIFDKISVDNKMLRDAYEKDKSLYVTKDNPPRQVPFEEVKEFIARKIKAEKSVSKFAEWDNALRRKAKIEITLDEAEQKQTGIAELQKNK